MAPVRWVARSSALARWVVRSLDPARWVVPECREVLAWARWAVLGDLCRHLR